MIYCQECVDLLADYLEGTLPPVQREQLEEHLSFCPPCVTFVRTYKATTRVARESLVADMPEEVSARLHEFMKKNLPTR